MDAAKLYPARIYATARDADGDAVHPRYVHTAAMGLIAAFGPLVYRMTRLSADPSHTLMWTENEGENQCVSHLTELEVLAPATEQAHDVLRDAAEILQSAGAQHVTIVYPGGEAERLT